MRAALVLLLTIPLLFTACGPSEEEKKQEEAKNAPPPPEPPTAAEIAQKIVNETQLDSPIPAEGTIIPPEAVAQYKGLFQNHKNVHSNTPEGKEALNMVGKRVEQRIRQTEKAKAWEPLLLLIEVHGVLNPGSNKFARQLNLAAAELRKPQITIKGIVSDGTTGIKIALLDLYLPMEKETVSDRIRVGEEKYGVKLQQVIGNDQGLLFEYRQTGETFEILTNKASQ
jgi:hypothetical protein